MKSTEQVDKNRTLFPFLILSILIALGLCVGLGYRNLRFAGMLLLFFAGVFVGLWILLALILWVISLFIDCSKPQDTWSRGFGQAVSYIEGMLCAISGIRVHVSGRELLPECRWLLVCNHRSNYDPIVTAWVLRNHPMAFISKPQNLRLPMVGPLLHKAGYLAIDRENDRAALKTILEAAKRIRSGAISYGVYPEGTRNPGTELLPFRNGAFKMAQKASAPLVIAAIQGTDQVRTRMPWRVTDVRLRFLAVLEPAELAEKHTAEIGEMVRQRINDALLPGP